MSYSTLQSSDHEDSGDDQNNDHFFAALQDPRNTNSSNNFYYDENLSDSDNDPFLDDTILSPHLKFSSTSRPNHPHTSNHPHSVDLSSDEHIFDHDVVDMVGHDDNHCDGLCDKGHHKNHSISTNTVLTSVPYTRFPHIKYISDKTQVDHSALYSVAALSPKFYDDDDPDYEESPCSCSTICCGWLAPWVWIQFIFGETMWYRWYNLAILVLVFVLTVRSIILFADVDRPGNVNHAIQFVLLSVTLFAIYVVYNTHSLRKNDHSSGKKKSRGRIDDQTVNLQSIFALDRKITIFVFFVFCGVLFIFIVGFVEDFHHSSSHSSVNGSANIQKTYSTNYLQLKTTSNLSEFGDVDIEELIAHPFELSPTQLMYTATIFNNLYIITPDQTLSYLFHHTDALNPYYYKHYLSSTPDKLDNNPYLDKHMGGSSYLNPFSSASASPTSLSSLFASTSPLMLYDQALLSILIATNKVNNNQHQFYTTQPFVYQSFPFRALLNATAEKKVANQSTNDTNTKSKQDIPNILIKPQESPPPFAHYTVDKENDGLCTSPNQPCSDHNTPKQLPNTPQFPNQLFPQQAHVVVDVDRSHDDPTVSPGSFQGIRHQHHPNKKKTASFITPPLLSQKLLYDVAQLRTVTQPTSPVAHSAPKTIWDHLAEITFSQWTFLFTILSIGIEVLLLIRLFPYSQHILSPDLYYQSYYYPKYLFPMLLLKDGPTATGGDFYKDHRINHYISMRSDGGGASSSNTNTNDDRSLILSFYNGIMLKLYANYSYFHYFVVNVVNRSILFKLFPLTKGATKPKNDLERFHEEQPELFNLSHITLLSALYYVILFLFIKDIISTVIPTLKAYLIWMIRPVLLSILPQLLNLATMTSLSPTESLSAAYYYINRASLLEYEFVLIQLLNATFFVVKAFMLLSIIYWLSIVLHFNVITLMRGTPQFLQNNTASASPKLNLNDNSDSPTSPPTLARNYAHHYPQQIGIVLERIQDFYIQQQEQNYRTKKMNKMFKAKLSKSKNNNADEMNDIEYTDKDHFEDSDHDDNDDDQIQPLNFLGVHFWKASYNCSVITLHIDIPHCGNYYRYMNTVGDLNLSGNSIPQSPSTTNQVGDSDSPQHNDLVDLLNYIKLNLTPLTPYYFVSIRDSKTE